MAKNHPLNDRTFLAKLDRQRYKELFAKITLLTFEEQPIEYIEGKITGGSINFDGASALRRTCNITIASSNLDTNLYYLGLERKFILEIGVLNEINNEYPDIIWFPMGLYVTSNFSTARSTNNYSISIQGKDKMALLSGDLSGNLPSSINFSTLEEVSEDGKTIIYTKVKIKDIIFNLIETYGNEMPHNIIINDIDETGLELLTYKGNKPAYIFCTKDEENTSHEFRCENITFDGKTKVQYKTKNNNWEITTLDTLKSEYFIPVKSLVNKNFEDNLQDTKGNFIYVTKIEYGDCIGYRETDLVYAGDLIANVNDTITSVLDKIKNMLGDFEYFYDTQGHFVFQKKKVLYEYDTWTPSQIGSDLESVYYDNNKIESNIFYNFEDNDLVISINNTPALTNAKNDYSLWGVRKSSTSGAEIPIHLRYAIEQKPISYTTYKLNDDQWTYVRGEDGSYDKNEQTKIITCDWREIIYQMALDYYKYKDLYNDFFAQVRMNNQTEDGNSLYPTGKTGYELYYVDILGFWRDIFSPDGKFYKQVILTDKLYIKDKYYTKKAVNSNIVDRFPVYELCKDYYYDDNKIYFELVENHEKENQHFCDNVINNPLELNFWFDFLDTTGELSKYSTKVIGQRSKCVNDNRITSIYYRPVPNLIFVNQKELGRSTLQYKSNYTYINTTEDLENCLVTAVQGKNAWEEAQSYLNNFARCTEQLSFTAIPIYYLIPNVRISLKDNQSKVSGEYVIDKISFNLNYNGTMSVTATKIFDQIY